MFARSGTNDVLLFCSKTAVIQLKGFFFPQEDVTFRLSVKFRKIFEGVTVGVTVPVEDGDLVGVAVDEVELVGVTGELDDVPVGVIVPLGEKVALEVDVGETVCERVPVGVDVDDALPVTVPL